MSEKYFTLDYVAQVLQVSYLTVYRWVRSGALPAYKVGRQYRISQPNFASFLEQSKPRLTGPISSSLNRFIGSGLMDYSYIENRHFPVDLSLGINPLGTPFDVRKFLAKQRDLIYSNYPSVVGEELCRKLAVYHGFRPENILIGAGVSELLHVVFLTYINPGDQILMPLTTFPAFEMLGILVHAQVSLVELTEKFTIDYAAFFERVTSQTKLVVLCNPNNPTGIGLSAEAVTKMAERHRSILFLIDEANIDFGGDSLIAAVRQLPNLIIARSFSKGFGLAGLRVGYLVANQDVIYALQRRQTPFMTNVVGQVVASRALDFPQFLEKSRQYCQKQRKWLERELNKLGFATVPSDSNYLLVDISSTGLSSKEFLSRLNGLGANAIDGHDFRGLGDAYIRLSPRDEKTNRKFITILKKALRN